MTHRSVTVPALLLALSLAAAACDARTSGETVLEPAYSTTTGATLIECPTDVTESTSGTIDLVGGTLSVAGSSIQIPAGAVLLPTEFTLSVPASNYMEIRVTANGAEHFQFEDVVTVTIGYDRCTRSNIDKAALVAWEIDPVTKALLENKGGTDHKSTKKVVFETDHFSGYAIAE